MFNLFLSFIFAFNSFNVSYNYETKVEKIEFVNAKKDNFIKLDLNFYAPIRDIITMKISFFDETKNLLNQNYYESTLIIEKRKSTSAKIPISVNEKTYLNIVLISNNSNKEIENIMFPVYPKEERACDLSKERICVSSYPGLVQYKEGKIYEEYSKIGLNSKDSYYSYSNFIPISLLSLSFDGIRISDYAELTLKEKVNEINVYYDDRYVFPLALKQNEHTIKFELENKYYLDKINGITSQDYFTGAYVDNEIILPFLDKEYKFKIEIDGSFISFGKVTIDFIVITHNNLIGRCSEAKYCFKRGYL